MRGELRQFSDQAACSIFTAIFARHARNIEISNVEIATETADARPAFYLDGVDGADFFRVRLPMRRKSDQFRLRNVTDFRVFGCQHYSDASADRADDKTI